MEIDWSGLRASAIEAMSHAYAPYSDFPVGVAGLVDDGRVIVGCNVENASYGVTLCAECGLVSSLHATGGGRLVAVSCVDANGNPLMPCGRCRQLLWENGGPECLVEALPRPLKMSELLPHAFGFDDLERVTGSAAGHEVPSDLAKWRGRGTVFVHPDLSGGETVWTAYWERSGGATDDAEKGVLEEGPNFPTTAQAVSWGLVRTPRIVVVDADGGLSWAGESEPPDGIPERWQNE
ncbi:cytidine deaminase [Actinoplanes sp. TBRC 11911]|uniref:cytidine deaminase n=1 Tax=Actinoplanes sp. TBRC 11911 TaxID=2729386 RepID=UPI00145DE4DD|nr:cytidine deaminase [Actinoplanes sp. TBRC 11911]NMO50338.1 cytidine deaminase [Actinoplanes sp. TBRC 11911]